MSSTRPEKRPKLEITVNPFTSHPDIIRSIASHLVLPLGDNLRSLASLSQINTLANEVVTPLLYRYVVFPRTDSVNTFASSFAHKQKRVLSEQYKELVEADYDLEVFMRIKQDDNTTTTTTTSSVKRKRKARLSVPPTVLAFKTWRWIETLEVDHEISEYESRSLVSSVQACLDNPNSDGTTPLLFPNLKKIIVRGNYGNRPERHPLKIKLFDELCTLLPKASKLEYICVDMPKIVGEPGNRAYVHDNTSRAIATRSGLSAWNILVNASPSIQKVIIHDYGNIIQFTSTNKDYRIDWASNPSLEDFTEYKKSRLGMYLVASLFAPVEEQRDIGNIELREIHGIQQAIGVGFTNHLIRYMGSLGHVNRQVLDGYINHFKYVAVGEDRPDCEACGRSMN